MATHVSSEKRARQAPRRNAINRARRSQVQTLVRELELAIAGNKPKDALEALRAVEACLASSAQKGLMPKKTASRKTSRLAQRVRLISKK